MKVAIVREADGEKGDPLHIEGKDNLEAASYIMLTLLMGKGASYTMQSIVIAVESYSL